MVLSTVEKAIRCSQGYIIAVNRMYSLGSYERTMGKIMLLRLLTYVSII